VTDFEAAMQSAFGVGRLRSGVALAPLTTFKVGGPADWLIETRTSSEMVAALEIARAANVAVTLLGGGSNVLVGDGGVRGLVIRARGGDVQGVDQGHIRADAAVTINGLVRWTINHGRAGLEAWAGTPGTVGGAIFGNASDHLERPVDGRHEVHFDDAPEQVGRVDARLARFPVDADRKLVARDARGGHAYRDGVGPAADGIENRSSKCRIGHIAAVREGDLTPRM